MVKPIALNNHRLSIANIRKSVDAIDDVFLDSPQFTNPGLSQELELDLTTKIETLNPIRSFKGRGAEALTYQLKKNKNGHLICASAGNFGQAMAYSCKKREIKLTVHASKNINPLKLKMMRLTGAKVESFGNGFGYGKSSCKEASQPIKC